MANKRMIVPVSFDNEDDYEFVKSKPNSAHYMRTLVKKDRENVKSDNKYLEDKVKELRDYIDRKLASSNVADVQISEDFKEDIKNALMAFD